MTAIRAGSFLLAFGCSVIGCGGEDDVPATDSYPAGSTGTTNDSAGTTSGAVATTGGESTAGTGGAASDGTTTNGPATTGGPLTGAATTDGATNGAATTGAATTGGATTGSSGTGGAASDAVTTAGDGSGGATTGGATTGGATTGDPNCFPPLSDFAARDGGFGSAERQIVPIGTGDSVSLFRPSDANFGQGGCQHPLLVWGNGSTNTVDIWESHLSRAASFGFVIVAPEQTQVNSGHMNDALDYVLALSQDSSSEYYNKVDTSKLGATGYSLGGAGAMGVASNDRIGATFIWDSFGNCSALHGPLGTIVAGDGLGGLDLIDDCPPLSFGMEAAGTNHTSVLGFPGGFGGPGGQTPYAQEGYVAWFRWHFMGDAAAEALFVGESCGFCTRDGISVRKNGFD